VIKVIQNKHETQGKTYDLVGPDTYSNAELLELCMQTTYRTNRFVSDHYKLNQWAQEAIISPELVLTKDETIMMEEMNAIHDPLSRNLTIHDIGVSPDQLQKYSTEYLRHFRPAKFINQ